jgi:hypothetical protein
MEGEAMRYNLTFWQKLAMPFIYCLWKLYNSPTKKTWHEVKKSMETHRHRYTKPYKYGLLQCEHQGCYVCNDPEYLDKDGYSILEK